MVAKWLDKFLMILDGVKFFIDDLFDFFLVNVDVILRFELFDVLFSPNIELLKMFG